MKLFCCDDDPEILNLVEKFFRLHGHEVATADSAFGLSKRLNEFVPDVLLLDHRMPGLTGENFLGVFQHSTLGKKTPVIFYTAEDRVKMERTLAKANVVAWIPKTVVGMELVNQVEKITGSISES